MHASAQAIRGDQSTVPAPDWRAKKSVVTSATYREIACTDDGGLLNITLARPDSLNAFTPRMLEELLDAFEGADADDSVRAVIVTGSGRAFCAGADLSAGAGAFLPSGAEGGEPRDTGGQLVLRILRSLKPVIAAINGPAVGVGATMTLPMDVRIASSTARLAFPFVRRGISPDGCSSWLLPRLVGMGVAQEWLLSGRMIEVAEARQAGLLHSVVEPDQLLQSADRVARSFIKSTSPVAIALTRRMTWRMLDEPSIEEAHRIESLSLAERSTSDDAAEGVRAFREKRAPAFPSAVSSHSDRIRELLGDG